MNEEARKETVITFFQNQEKEERWEVHVSRSERKCTWCHKDLHKGEECFRIQDGLIHIPCLKFRESLRPAWWIAEKLGISSDQFKRLAKQLFLKPDNYYVNQYKRAVGLWDPALVEKLKDTSPVIEARARTARRNEKEGLKNG